MKILIVDDEHSYGSLLGSVLKKLGHRAIVCQRSEEAISTAREEELDGAFVDLVMPEGSGVELVRSLRHFRPSLPVAFIAGSAPSAAQSELGTDTPVLPKVWTVGDVQRILHQITTLAAGMNTVQDTGRLARSSRQVVPDPDPVPVPDPDQGSDDDGDLRGSQALARCRNWNRLAQLCMPALARKNSHLVVRSGRQANIGDQLRVVLMLPNELGVVIDGVVEQVTTVADGRFRLLLNLTGLTSGLASKLMRVLHNQRNN